METNMSRHLIKTSLPTPVGDITLLIDGDTILICEFSDHGDRVVRQIERFYKDDHIVDDDCPQQILEVVQAYFGGDRDALNTLKTDPLGTPFERSVWKALREIPAGTTDSYGALAKRLGSSPRAVGRANGRNPVGLVHPCHRIIGADGSLTGYAGGLDRKEWLLKHEGAILNLQPSARPQSIEQ